MLVSIFCWPYSISSGVPTQINGLSSVSDIATGMGSLCALISDGTVKCLGRNFGGQLGDGTTTDRSAPTIIPDLDNVTAISMHEYNGCALLADNTTKCWGYNHIGQLGSGTTSGSGDPAVPFPTTVMTLE